MRDAKTMTVDDAAGRMHQAGWSAGDIGHIDGWTVVAHRGEHVIRAEAPTQSEAWVEAARQARLIDEG